MREILFRAKSNYGNVGEWEYGLVAQPHITEGGVVTSYYFTKLCENGYSSQRTVSANSIGQYTGLIDKNGTKIFEGDICSSKGMVYRIIWLDDKYGWFCKVLKSNSCLIDTTMAFPLYQYDNRPENGYRQLEIIGNIHDNPELMEE